jgi:lactate dehydrogenase-like 2-hydroxyacid dehydrogenase
MSDLSINLLDPPRAKALHGGTILATGTSVDPALLEPLRELGFTIRRPARSLSQDELARELRGTVAYLHGGEEFATREALRGARDSLKIIAFLGVGYQNFIDVAAAHEFGIAVTSTPGAATDSVATFTVGQIINANWRIAANQGRRHPAWNGAHDLPREIGACEIGIVGLGAIGTRIAEILIRGFGAKVSYFSRTRKPETEKSLGVSYLPLPELAARSDILVVMVPETDDTTAMIDAKILSRMKSGTILVNTARPAVVDPYDLHESLKKTHVGVAVFDGFYAPNSKIANNLLADFGDRLIVTGHIASHTREAMDRMVRHAVLSIEKALAGVKDRSAANVAGAPGV